MKGNLTTDDNGSVVLKNLHLGTYVIREVQAPENFYNAGEEKTVTLSYAGQNVETVFSDIQRRKIKDCETGRSGGRFQQGFCLRNGEPGRRSL